MARNQRSMGPDTFATVYDRAEARFYARQVCHKQLIGIVANMDSQLSFDPHGVLFANRANYWRQGDIRTIWIW